MVSFYTMQVFYLKSFVELQKILDKVLIKNCVVLVWILEKQHMLDDLLKN